ncbi:MAG: HD domain-containing protein [Nanoarchaeota archaeon]|nr:HD domain-containing protein [Nanoarchaeota archaeon]MBU1135371.1 HD domain-containing protein [Nanoarchaeota archaeon]MBU2520102.1 HD domain-containing protein [Nanoarchaeota archaeon]
MIYTTNLVELPSYLHIGTFEDDRKQRRKKLEIEKHHDTNDSRVFSHIIGDKNFLVVGELYLDLLYTKLMSRLIGVEQLGIVKGYKMFTGANQNRYYHSVDTGIRMECAARKCSSYDEDVDICIAAGLLHDAYVPPFSDIGNFGRKNGIDEEIEITRIKDDEEVMSVLEKHKIDPDAVIDTIRGEHKYLGQLLNSKNGLDVDGISYTLIDSFFAVPIYMRSVEEFRRFVSNPQLHYIHEEIIIDDNGEIKFTDAYNLRDFLTLRSHMWAGVYKSSPHRARCVFFEKMMSEFWGKNDISDDEFLQMSDFDFKKLLDKKINSKYDKGILENIFSCLMTDRFEEIDRIYDSEQLHESIEKAKKTYGDAVVVRKQKGFKAATQTLVKIPEGLESSVHEDWKGLEMMIEDGDDIVTFDEYVPFERVFPDASKEIEKTSDEKTYTGLYIDKERIEV